MTFIKQVRPIVIYTDGSCLKPGGAGGWAAIIVNEEEVIELSGHHPSTTNNRMEMTAALHALVSLPRHSYIYLHTDSQYLQRGIRDWVPMWKLRGWITRTNQPVVNRDLWEQLDVENQRHIVTWLWVRGHDGDHYNERCDQLASKAARCNQLQKGI